MSLKIGYVIDSASGLSKAQAQAKGFYFLPLIITINGKEYLDGDTLQAHSYYQQIKLEDGVKTAATPLGLAKQVLKQAARENDHVIVYSISKYLSSQFNNLKMIAKTINNVHIVNSEGVATTIEKDLAAIKMFAKKNDNIAQIMRFANENASNWSALLVPKTLSWLVKGGRVNASIAAMASLLKIVPIIRFQKGQLEKEGKGRIYKRACLKSFKKIADESKDKTVYILTKNAQVEPAFDDALKKSQVKIIFCQIPPIIANHCGPNTFIALTRIK